jgi:hypothetical protein
VDYRGCEEPGGGNGESEEGFDVYVLEEIAAPSMWRRSRATQANMDLAFVLQTCSARSEVMRPIKYATGLDPPGLLDK